MIFTSYSTKTNEKVTGKVKFSQKSPFIHKKRSIFVRKRCD